MTGAELFGKAVQFHQAGNLAQAEQLYRQVLSADPSHADAHANLGVLLARQGRLPEALGCYQAALRCNPRHAEVYFNLGNVLRRIGRFEEAVLAYQSAVQLNPGQVGAHYNLGLALVDLGRLDEAMASFEQTLRLQPDFAEALNQLGNSLQRKGRVLEAVDSFKHFLQLRPHDPRGYNNLGLALIGLNRLDEAVKNLEQALRLKPDYAEGHNSLAVALETQGRVDEALAHWRQALRLKPDAADVLNNLGNAFTTAGNLDEAIDCFRKSLTLQPHAAHVHSNLLLTLNYHPGYDAAALFNEHQRWAAQHLGGLAPAEPPAILDRTPGRRLRIGYVSADFRDHTVAAFIEPVLAAHDRSRFQIFAYANVARPDEVTRRLQAHTNTWRSIAGFNDADAAALIRKDAIDILVDLGGHTAGNRLLLFARQPAPIQLSHFGYPNTTAVPAIHYRISDAYADPPGRTEAFYTEKLVRLPEIAWCYQASLSPEVGDLPAQLSGRVTFGSFNNLAKVTADVISLWSRLLRALPSARLLLLTGRGQSGNTRVQKLFAQQGIGGDRVTWLARRPRAEYFRLHQQVDICLDPFPYNGGVTTCDALWMGIPVITLAGATYVSRQGVSLLSNLGLPDLIAATPDDYVACAVRLANDLPRLRQLRASLRQRMRESPVTDAARLTRYLEETYRRLWEQWPAVRT